MSRSISVSDSPRASRRISFNDNADEHSNASDQTEMLPIRYSSIHYLTDEEYSEEGEMDDWNPQMEMRRMSSVKESELSRLETRRGSFSESIIQAPANAPSVCPLMDSAVSLTRDPAGPAQTSKGYELSKLETRLNSLEDLNRAYDPDEDLKPNKDGNSLKEIIYAMNYHLNWLFSRIWKSRKRSKLTAFLVLIVICLEFLILGIILGVVKLDVHHGRRLAPLVHYIFGGISRSILRFRSVWRDHRRLLFEGLKGDWIFLYGG